MSKRNAVNQILSNLSERSALVKNSIFNFTYQQDVPTDAGDVEEDLRKLSELIIQITSGMERVGVSMFEVNMEWEKKIEYTRGLIAEAKKVDEQANGIMATRIDEKYMEALKSKLAGICDGMEKSSQEWGTAYIATVKIIDSSPNYANGSLGSYQKEAIERLSKTIASGLKDIKKGLEIIQKRKPRDEYGTYSGPPTTAVAPVAAESTPKTPENFVLKDEDEEVNAEALTKDIIEKYKKLEQRLRIAMKNLGDEVYNEEEKDKMIDAISSNKQIQHLFNYLNKIEEYQKQPNQIPTSNMQKRYDAISKTVGEIERQIAEIE